MGKIVVSVIGAGGKMGTRTSNNLAKKPEEFDLLLVEASEAGIQSIKDRGFEPTPVEEALEKSDVVVFAVPDTLIGKLSAIYVPQLKPGTGFIILDHPSYFLDQDTFEARQDRFGGCGGKQDIVMSKIQGDDDRFAQCVEVAKQMYAPVEHAYVMSSEQIAFLEPTLVELLGATCLYAMAETVDEAVKRGIPKEAAVSFLTGHIYNLSANFLGYIPGNPPVSDACKVAIGLGNRLVMREDWKKIWDDEVLNKVIATMLHPDKPQI